MFHRKKLLPGFLSLLIIAGVLFIPTDLTGSQTDRSGANPNAPLYALPGPQPVGTRILTGDDGAPLDLTIWYPALLSGAKTETSRYPYRIKMGNPFGSVSVASYSGQAFADAPYDLSEGPHAMVILSPGFILGTTDYAWLAEHLASYGFVVVAVEHQEVFDEDVHGLWRATILRPQEILDVLAYLDRQVD